MDGGYLLLLCRSLQPLIELIYWILPFLDQVCGCGSTVGVAFYHLFMWFIGRLDRKIEFPIPNEEARARILQIHARKMNVSKEVNFEELAQCTEDFNGAQCKAVCVEAVSSCV